MEREPVRVDLHVTVAVPRYVWWAVTVAWAAVGLAALLIADAVQRP